jgi:exodeoxyribonuclease III
MKIVSWNINGIKARNERLINWISNHQPDVLCLQETKNEDKSFPTQLFETLGYHVVFTGQKSFNGVAIASKEPVSDVVSVLPGDDSDEQKRFLSVRWNNSWRIVCIYVPNGAEVGSDKYEYKLKWLARLNDYLKANLSKEESWVIGGDYNIIPADLDVYDPKEWTDTILCSPRERAAFTELQALGLTDTARHLYPTDPMYTWWDYRNFGFPKNKGMRIDHFLTNPTALSSVQSVVVDRQERKGKQPSDHAPVVLEINP